MRWDKSKIFSVTNNIMSQKLIFEPGAFWAFAPEQSQTFCDRLGFSFGSLWALRDSCLWLSHPPCAGDWLAAVPSFSTYSWGFPVTWPYSCFTSTPSMEPSKVQSEGGLNVTLTIRLLMHGKVSWARRAVQREVGGGLVMSLLCASGICPLLTHCFRPRWIKGCQYQWPFRLIKSPETRNEYKM